MKKWEDPKLLIAKIDGSENEVESIPITGFPTLYFFQGNKKNKSPMEYKGKRETEDIIEFIKRYSYNKIIDEDVNEEVNNENNDSTKENKQKEKQNDEKTDKISDL